jgi:hypothetical protein
VGDERLRGFESGSAAAASVAVPGAAHARREAAAAVGGFRFLGLARNADGLLLADEVSRGACTRAGLAWPRLCVAGRLDEPH